MTRFNRIAAPADFIEQQVVDRHPLVTDEILEGQSPMRAWEYSQALRALGAAGLLTYDHSPLIFAEIGGASSNFWKALTNYTRKPITAIDPNHLWASDDQAAMYFRDRLSRFKVQEPDRQFDAVFCLSVIEHIPANELQQFEADLASLVKPGGLLVLTCDAAESHPDVWHFHWMRERIYTPGGLAALQVVYQQQYGFTPIDDPDYTWKGPTTYDYSAASLVLVKDP